MLSLPVFVGVGIVVISCLVIWIYMYFKDSNPDIPQRKYHQGSNRWGYGAGGVVLEARKTNVSIPDRYTTLRKKQLI